LGACGDLTGSTEVHPTFFAVNTGETPEEPLNSFAFIPAVLREGQTTAGQVAGQMEGEGNVALAEEDSSRGKDNGKFRIEGAELILQESLSAGPHRVLFRVQGGAGEDFAYEAVVFVIFDQGPVDVEFTPARLLANTAAARGLVPVGTFSPAGGLGPYSYSLVTGAEDNDKDNGKFWSGVEGITARQPLAAGDYNIYLRCIGRNGKFYEKAFVITVAAYEPPSFDDADFVRIPGGTVSGDYEYDSSVFVDGRNITIPPYMLAKYETTRGFFWEILTWAKDNGYTFGANLGLPTTAPSEADKGKPQVGVNWRGVAAWLNALSEKNELTPVYYTDEDFISLLRAPVITNKTGVSGQSLYTTPVYTNWEANGYRLPCMDEWEFASRGGVPSLDPGSVWMQKYPGTNDDKEYALKYGWDLNSIPPGEVAPIDTVSAANRQPVGLLLPNAFGLYDMGGNATEFCGNYHSESNDFHVVPNADTPFRGYYVVAGGEWIYYAQKHLVKGGNSGLSSALSGTVIGFRMARTIQN
jgi:formylglycine-generating enzyme required for sulfatase activity